MLRKDQPWELALRLIINQDDAKKDQFLIKKQYVMVFW